MYYLIWAVATFRADGYCYSLVATARNRKAIADTEKRMSRMLLNISHMLTAQEKDLAKKVAKYGLTPENIMANLTSSEKQVFVNFQNRARLGQTSAYEFQAEIDKTIESMRNTKQGIKVAGSVLGAIGLGLLGEWLND